MSRILLSLLAFALISPAFAQADLDLEAELLENAQAQEQKNQEKVAIQDPDLTLAQKVFDTRKAFEQKLNDLQSKAARFVKTDEAYARLSQKFLKESEDFYAKTTPALLEYDEAFKSGDQKKQKKLSQSIGKTRQAHLNKLKTFESEVKKIESEYEKLAKRAAKEDAEDAAAKAKAEAQQEN